MTTMWKSESRLRWKQRRFPQSGVSRFAGCVRHRGHQFLKLEATVIRPKDDDELDGLAASISFPVEYDDEAIGEALGDHD